MLTVVLDFIIARDIVCHDVKHEAAVVSCTGSLLYAIKAFVISPAALGGHAAWRAIPWRVAAHWVNVELAISVSVR